MFQLKFKNNLIALAVTASLHASPLMADDYNSDAVFSRVSTFPVFLNTDITEKTVSEIVAATDDGNTLIYTDSKLEKLGFVDIRDPAKPRPLGVVAMGGEPTSVAISGNYALVAVNTSPSYIAPTGKLVVVDIAKKMAITTISLNGQPDSISISPDKRYAAIAIENERDEDLGDGRPSQAPAGSFIIVDLVGSPDKWTTRVVDVTGLSGMLYADDPEPEYVDINKQNLAVLSLQENNHIVLIDLPSGRIVNHFSAGTVDLDNVDTSKNKLIELNSSLVAVPREPDGVVWISDTEFAIADEGDMDGGSRGFTIFDTQGKLKFEAGTSLEYEIVKHGHYPDKRSGKKGNEPENVEYGKFGKNEFLFVGSERASVVMVYKLKKKGNPKLVQVLPAAVKPEGLLAIPQRNLFVSAGEKDDRDDKMRSALTIYKLGEDITYPTIVSKDRKDGTPIPWGALSGLAIDRHDDETAYTIHDSFYDQSRIFKLDIDKQPAEIEKEIILNDMMGKLAAISPEKVNADGSVNLDQEGIAISADGGFWIASEGRGTVGDLDRPFETYNLLLKVSKKGMIEEVIMLPDTVNARQIRFGFEGVTSVGSVDNEVLYVAFQREWAGDPDGMVRIGRYDTAASEWTFFYYPLDVAESMNGGWVGLSEISALGKDKFLVVERDNQGGPDAAIKRIYSFSVAGLTPLVDSGEMTGFPVVSKQLKRDLMTDLKATGGLVLEKIEGLAILPKGDVLVVNDNDGVDDSNGETQLLKLKGMLKKEKSKYRKHD